MDIRRYAAACAAVFLCMAAVDAVFDILILSHFDGSLQNISRPDAIRWLEPVLYLAASVTYVPLFVLAGGQKGMARAIWLGVLFGLLVSGTFSFRQFAAYPIPLALSMLWFAEGMIQYVLAGIVIALIYRRKPL